jgi:hypothetical protein
MASTTPPAMRRGLRTALLVGVAGGLLGLAAGCGGGSPAAPDTARPQAVAAPGDAAELAVSDATLKAGEAVPLPTGKTVLTLTGKISVTNKDGLLVLDQRTINRMGLVQAEMYEPWAKQTMAFRGVRLRDLLQIVGVDSGATRLRITALDDYKVELSMADVRTGGILLATEAGDGSALPVDKGGPTRIVFENGVKAGANADQWIWSLKTIDVE